MTSVNAPLATDRRVLMAALAQRSEVDLIVIGGGATGLGVALDAALRGLSVVLLESFDFAKGTSSRATKLLHGGVRYLAQGNISLVREALHERSTILHNAPHLASPLPFVVPGYACWETPFYGAGLKAYDLLAGRAGLGPTEFLSARQTQNDLPGIKTQHLKGGVKYWDAQFDDARLALALARTAARQGALVLNYCAVTRLLYDVNRVVGVQCEDTLTAMPYTIRAKCVVNATGVWVDEFRGKDSEAIKQPTTDIVSPSQGVHLIVDRSFLPTDHALLVPKTADKRVLFMVPWLGKLILGTTDTPRHDLSLEPEPFAHEIAFILHEAGKYLERAPTRQDIKSIWVGLRPLVKPAHEHTGTSQTRRISREHTILVSDSGLVTVTGGKWTTYRVMAQEVLDRCVVEGLLGPLPPSRTAHFLLVGASPENQTHNSLMQPPGLHAYGNERDLVSSLEGAGHELTPGLTEVMIRFAARYEYALNIEDVLARRFRLLFLDARLAARVAPQAARILQQETGLDPQLNNFLQLTEHYLRLPV